MYIKNNKISLFYILLILIFNIILSENKLIFDCITKSTKYLSYNSMNKVYYTSNNIIPIKIFNRFKYKYTHKDNIKKKISNENEVYLSKVRYHESYNRRGMFKYLRSDAKKYRIINHVNKRNIFLLDKVKILLNNKYANNLKYYMTKIDHFTIDKISNNIINNRNIFLKKINRNGNKKKEYHLLALSNGFINENSIISDNNDKCDNIYNIKEQNSISVNKNNICIQENDINENSLKENKKKKKRILSEESKKNMREKLKSIMREKWKNSEFRKKMINSFRKRGIEHNKKISEAVKNKWKYDENYKLKTLEGQRKYFMRRKNANVRSTSEDTKNKISKAMKQYWQNKNKYKKSELNNLQSIIKKKKKHKKVWENIYSIILNQKSDDFNNYHTFHNLSVNLQAALN
ncbi:conserved Plasmodium protein, unknown function [Plasmodium relictum]|uniref:Nuclease associated modular domain-containing protein n=1 Tax=Plasmodium relictum TaxID=85471 RepID=A0A1J1H7C3_PLARL|nr:conserved Plasmodium protein, unknown function [Plasmodium relictum]CRG99326.1 conserved Plasmodium protein, unknown function [Plasmodium relictum]